MVKIPEFCLFLALIFEVQSCVNRYPVSVNRMSDKNNYMNPVYPSSMPDPTVIRASDGYFYLFASTGTCCEGIKSTYTTVVGRSENLFGPYLDKTGLSMNDNNHEILIHGSDRFVGTGHNSEIVTDNKIRSWILYHAVDKINPKDRVLMLDEIKWKGGWPFVEGSIPANSSSRPSF